MMKVLLGALLVMGLSSCSCFSKKAHCDSEHKECTVEKKCCKKDDKECKDGEGKTCPIKKDEAAQTEAKPEAKKKK